MSKSAKEGYSEASDGSQQVKVRLQCPQCRSKYECRKFGSEVIIGAVLVVRQAHAMQGLLRANDDDLAAGDLGRKDAFLKSTSMEELQDALRRLEDYQAMIGKGRGDATLPDLDFAALSDVLPQSLSGDEIDDNFWKDPTLFYGLEELLTKDEQEFLTKLFISGKTELLMQASIILSGILAVAADRQATLPAGPAPTVDVHKLRLRYPLPRRMPRCVRLPSADAKGRPLLKLEVNSLALKAVKGPAGQSGLRRGDVVSHIDGQRLESPDDFERFLAEADSDMEVVVNADDETAAVLRERFLQMKRDKIRLDR